MGKVMIPLFFDKHLSLYRKPYLAPVFRSADETYELFNEEIFSEGLLKSIPGKPSLFLSITPPHPIMREPVVLVNSRLVLEFIVARRPSSIDFSNSSELIENMLLVNRHHYYPLVLKYDTKSARSLLR